MATVTQAEPTEGAAINGAGPRNFVEPLTPDRVDMIRAGTREAREALKEAKKATRSAEEAIERIVQITPPNIGRVRFEIKGTAPYVQARFSYKAQILMEEKMQAGSQSTKGRKREARDFDADYEGAKHLSEEGWAGIPASAFRNAMISACRLVGFKMTLGKLCLFVEADGFDKVDGIPLIKINGTPEQNRVHVRNATGVIDIRVRPMWRDWSASLVVRYDQDQFSVKDITNLLHRAGVQIGVGEGRPDSKSSAGQGWGTFGIGND